MTKGLFQKNGWNVIRRYMFKDSKKLATGEKNPTIACITAYKNGRRVKYINKTKTICTTTCFYLIAATPAGLPGKAITWPFTPGERLNIFFFSKMYLFSSIQIIHNILSCQIKKIYGGSLLGFFSTTERKGTLKPLKSTGKQLKTQAPT